MKIAVLLSGGVDSAVALHRAREEGHDVTAFYLKIWLQEELSFLGDCPWEEDLRHVHRVCDQAGVPLEIVPFQSEYQEQVVARALEELRRGRTPSPDLLCNRQIKFGLFLERIGSGFDRVVSGHYAQVAPGRGTNLVLKRSPDPVKDQTYFLSRLTQEQLRRAWFPIGHLTKGEVRARARELNLPNRDRKDSQGICFLGKIKYLEFVRFHLGEKPGDILDIDTGARLGEHQGVWFHTVGQRQGLRLGAGPWYVVRKDMAKNLLFVSHADRHPRHARDLFEIADVHWIGGPPADAGPLQARLRHAPHLENCWVRAAGSDRWEVRLETPDPGVAPGQAAVLYEGDVCLGAGFIE